MSSVRPRNSSNYGDPKLRRPGTSRVVRPPGQSGIATYISTPLLGGGSCRTRSLSCSHVLVVLRSYVHHGSRSLLGVGRGEPQGGKCPPGGRVGLFNVITRTEAEDFATGQVRIDHAALDGSAKTRSMVPIRFPLPSNTPTPRCSMARGERGREIRVLIFRRSMTTTPLRCGRAGWQEQCEEPRQALHS